MSLGLCVSESCLTCKLPYLGSVKGIMGGGGLQRVLVVAWQATGRTSCRMHSVVIQLCTGPQAAASGLVNSLMST